MLPRDPSARAALGLLLAAALTCTASAEPPARSSRVAATLAPPAPAPAAALLAAVPPSEPVQAAGPALTVRETAGAAREGEVVRSGIPLPRALGVRDTDRLAVVDAAGRPVPAEFRVLARWNAGLADRSAPVQWLLVAFPATVPAHGSASYRLMIGGPANPPPARPLVLRREGKAGDRSGHGERIVVDTGAAVFTLGGDGAALFERVALPGGAALIEGGSLTAAVGSERFRHAGVRRLRVEHAGPLTASVILDGAYDMPPSGEGGLGSRRRYVFAAGSPTALVTQSVAWEGNLGCQGCVVAKDGGVNGLRLERVRDLLSLRLGQIGARGGLAVTAFGARDAKPVAATLAAGEEAWVRQRQRPERSAPLAFDVRAGSDHGAAASGTKADGALLAATGPAGTVAVALDHMHRYEPQALRLLPGGEMALDLADDHVWLAHHQGLFASLAVAALPGRAPGGEEPAELERRVWAPLNHPLRAWPDAAWFDASQAVEEVPVGRLSGPFGEYDEAVSGALERTLQEVDGEGIAGLMTFGVYPRYWGKWGSPELDCGGRPGNLPPPGGRKAAGADGARGGGRSPGRPPGRTALFGPDGAAKPKKPPAEAKHPRPADDDAEGDDAAPDQPQAEGPSRKQPQNPAQRKGKDPTPDERWDDAFWCGTWTDYHNTTATAVSWAMRTGEVEWLDEVSSPAARRTLYTQVMQCAPGDTWFYCGQAPAGYGGYRRDFNSSHAYFENLILYYWLTGDSTVVDVLRRGAESMRRRMCELRGPGAVGEPHGPDGPACPPDHPFLHATFTGRVASQWLAVFRFVGLASEDASFLDDYRGGLARGITLQYAELARDGRRYGFLGKPLAEPGRGVAGPMWTNAFYDANNLYRLARDTGDAPLGDPPVRPSQVLAALARTAAELEPRAEPDPSSAAPAGPAAPAGHRDARRGWPRLLAYSFTGGRIGGSLTDVSVPPESRPLYNPEKAGMAALLVRAGVLSGDRTLLREGSELARLALGASRAEGLPLGKLQGQYLTRLHPSVALLSRQERER